MEMYLAIITTALVITQIIRVSQNAINLHRQNTEIKKVCGWLQDNDVSERDFEVQRNVFYMLNQKLRNEGYTVNRGIK